MQHLVDRKCSGVLNHPNKTFLKLYYEAGVAFEKQKLDDALRKILDALHEDPDDADALVMLAAIFNAKHVPEAANTTFEKALRVAPMSSWVEHSMAMFKFYHQNMDEARRRMGRAIELEPGEAAHRVNYAVILEKSGFITDGEAILRDVLAEDGENADALNALSINLLEQARYDEAIVIGRDAVKYGENNARARGNLAIAYLFLGDFHACIQWADAAIDMTPMAKTIRMADEWFLVRGQSHLGLGRLREGWPDYLDKRMAISTGNRLQQTKYMPFTNNPTITGKRVLVMLEQGLGDEIAFSGTLHDLVEEAEKVFVACDPRLVKPLSMHFPSITFLDMQKELTPHKVRFFIDEKVFKEISPEEVILSADLFKIYRNDISDFAGKPCGLGYSRERSQYWRNKLGRNDPRPKIGICWRSGTQKGHRKKYYANMKYWAKILKRYDFHVISLQYDDARADITSARSLYDFHIHRFDEADIDLKNDIADNAALCASLDLVISAQTAAGTIAGAVGTETWFVAPSQPWTSFGVKDRLPMFGDNVRCFWSDDYADWDQVFARLEEELDKKFPNARKKAA